jgi:hypothetical protein
MEPYRLERSGMYRPAVPSRIPRSVPDEDFNEIFAALHSHRDRALVAFYVSTGARASELLSATRGGADPGRQLITVVRKGTRELQQLPASTDAFVWLRLYQLEMDGELPRGSGQPLWWTLRRPFRPLAYQAAHRMFERAGRAAGMDATLHSLRHTAAYRMAEDPALPLTDVILSFSVSRGCDLRRPVVDSVIDGTLAACLRLFHPSGSLPDRVRAGRWSPSARASWRRSRALSPASCLLRSRAAVSLARSDASVARWPAGMAPAEPAPSVFSRSLRIWLLISGWV